MPFKRETYPLGINRIYWLYSEVGLAFRNRKASRSAIWTRAPILVKAHPNVRWCEPLERHWSERPNRGDFAHDQFACGRRLRMLKVVDDVTRECMAAIPDTSIWGRRLASELTALIERRGQPGFIVSGNGAELTSNAIPKWCAETNIEWHYIALSKPPRAHTGLRYR